MLKLIAQDKANHIIYGLLVFIVVNLFFGPVIGLAASIVVGCVKELYDLLTKSGTPDGYDILATAFGGVLGSLCTIQTIVFVRGLLNGLVS